jgi:hypothetical protein
MRRILLVGSVAALWVAAFLYHREVVLATGYLDIDPWLMAAGLLQCFVAGAAARALMPDRTALRNGAVAGMLPVVAAIAGQLLLVALYHDGMPLDPGGETWFSFLLEAWFWLGVPFGTGAALGAAGWWAWGRTDLSRPASPSGRGRGTPRPA